MEKKKDSNNPEKLRMEKFSNLLNKILKSDLIGQTFLLCNKPTQTHQNLLA